MTTDISKLKDPKPSPPTAQKPILKKDNILGGLEVMKVHQRINYINLLVYGDSGVGKTVLAGSADEVPDLNPVLFVDIEGGTLSLSNRFPEVDAVRVDTWQKMQEVYDRLRQQPDRYRTVVLDSLTEIQKFAMDNIMSDLLREFPDRDPDVPGLREWGKSTSQMRRFVRAFRDLPCNTIFTALAQSDKDPRTGLTKTKPSLPGKLSNEVAGFLDIVVYYYKKVVDGNVKRLLLTQGTDQQVAKDRSDMLPAIVEDPSMSQLYNLITKRN